ncbi:hypothetical protein [Arthrobacter sp. AL12]|uniref:hypothetical protein n=1 Tax=Arthrobacter sp. AL12 TaxID=3042241 RepID=UPI00249A9FE8|nr:hypothetical protein [Arthrobacter sp. AL12]MDI3213579.1 hypothetical protein [Arthrobacter sp. AL12]
MRKWIAAHRKMVALVVLAVAYAAGVVLLVSLGHELEETLFSAALWFVFTVVAWYLDARRQRKTAAKLEDQGGLLVYVRYPDSRPGSLSGIWNMGVATFDEAAGMKFQPAVYDNLEPSGRPTTFSALAAVSSEPRKIDRKERNYVPQRGFQAIRLTTDKGDIEVAAGPESLRKILDTSPGPS